MSRKQKIQKPTQKQLKLLQKLGYKGRVKSLFNASKLIKSLLSEVKIEKEYIPIDELAEKLNQVRPNSEIWFDHQLKLRSLDINFKTNIVLNEKYIADFVDLERKIIIELDGTYHDSKYVQNKDLTKDLYLAENGYTVIRIKHNDMLSLDKGIQEYLDIVYNKKTLIKTKSKSIKHSSNKPCQSCKIRTGKLNKFEYHSKSYKYCDKCFSSYSSLKNRGITN